MKTTFAILYLFLISFQGNSQNMIWLKKAGGTAFDYANALVVDDAGNSYITGQVENIASFGTHSLGNNGIHDIFIAKYNPAGNDLWVKSAGGVGGDVAHSICMDPEGNLIITGEMENSFNYEGNALNSMGANDVFIFKYDNDGNLVYAKRAGGTGNDKGRAVCADNSGNIYVAGFYEGTAQFDSEILYCTGNIDGFLVKYDVNGNAVWARKIGGTGEDEIKGISCDPSGNVYFTGLFEGTATIDGTSITSNGELDVFVGKFSPAGNLLWIKKGGGTKTDIARGLKVDPSGNVYITGSVEDSVKFENASFETEGWADAFVAKYNDSGVFQWLTLMGGNYFDEGRGLGLDAGGNNIYVTGNFQSSAAFGPTTVNSSGGEDIFITRLSPSGEFRGTQKAGGVEYDGGYGVGVDGSGNVFGAGYYRSSATFDGGTVMSSSGQSDIYLAKFSSIVSGTGEAIFAEKNVQVFPNPSNGDFSVQTFRPESWRSMKLFDARGSLVKNVEPQKGNDLIPVSAKELEDGIYFLILESGGDTYKARIVIRN